MQTLDGRKILIMATDGFEKSELFEPRKQLAEAGAGITIASIETGEIKSWDEKDWGESVSVDTTLDSVSADDFDALVLPGGQINPDLLRVEDKAVELVREFDRAGKTIAAICHAPWLIVEAGIAKGRKMTSYKSIRTDVENAGAEWRDDSAVVDGNLITSRNPGDLDDFCKAIANNISEERRIAA